MSSSISNIVSCTVLQIVSNAVITIFGGQGFFGTHFWLRFGGLGHTFYVILGVPCRVPGGLLEDPSVVLRGLLRVLWSIIARFLDKSLSKKVSNNLINIDMEFGHVLGTILK